MTVVWPDRPERRPVPGQSPELETVRGNPGQTGIGRSSHGQGAAAVVLDQACGFKGKVGALEWLIGCQDVAAISEHGRIGIHLARNLQFQVNDR